MKTGQRHYPFPFAALTSEYEEKCSVICLYVYSTKKGNLFISFFRDVNMNLKCLLTALFFVGCWLPAATWRRNWSAWTATEKRPASGSSTAAASCSPYHCILSGENQSFMFAFSLHAVRRESDIHVQIFSAYCQVRISPSWSHFICILSGENQFFMPTFSLHTVRWKSDLHVHLFSANCQVRIGPSRSFFSANCQVRIDCNATFTDYFSPVLMSLVPCKNNSLAAYRFLDILFSFVSVPQQCHFVKRTIRNANFQNSWTSEK